MPTPGAARHAAMPWLALILRYERHLSAAGMVLGFTIDNFTFGRIDRPRAHLIFACYLVLAATTIAAAHWLQTRADRIRATAAPDLRASEEAMPPLETATPDPDPPSRNEVVSNGSPAARWRTWLP